MRNQENKTSHTDEIANNEFVENLLKSLLWVEPKRLIEVRAFFSQAFLLHTEDEVFDETSYRSEWASNIYALSELCKPFEKYSEKELEILIDNELAKIKKESEVRRA